MNEKLSESKKSSEEQIERLKNQLDNELKNGKVSAPVVFLELSLIRTSSLAQNLELTNTSFNDEIKGLKQKIEELETTNKSSAQHNGSVRNRNGNGRIYFSIICFSKAEEKFSSLKDENEKYQRNIEQLKTALANSVSIRWIKFEFHVMNYFLLYLQEGSIMKLEGKSLNDLDDLKSVREITL